MNTNLDHRKPFIFLTCLPLGALDLDGTNHATINTSRPGGPPKTIYVFNMFAPGSTDLEGTNHATINTSSVT
jgi:hypothetical protein